MLIVLYGLYLALSLIVLRFAFDRKERLYRFVIAAALPAIGWLMPLLWMKPGNNVMNWKQFDDYVTSLQQEHDVRKIGMYSRKEKEKELNVIPIEDALLVSEHRTRRRIMIDVLKDDATHYLEILQKAVSNEDTETSHYAVSAIMEVKRKLLLAIQELSVEYERNQENEHIIRTYAEVLRKYMKSGFLDERTLTKHRFTYLSVLERLTAVSNDTEWVYREKVDTELALGQYAEAEATALQYMERHPFDEEAYLSMLNVHYETRSAAKLQKVLEQLKKTPLRLSHRALKLVRFWSEGA